MARRLLLLALAALGAAAYAASRRAPWRPDPAGNGGSAASPARVRREVEQARDRLRGEAEGAPEPS